MAIDREFQSEEDKKRTEEIEREKREKREEQQKEAPKE
jgi:hypothetical protein